MSLILDKTTIIFFIFIVLINMNFLYRTYSIKPLRIKFIQWIWFFNVNFSMCTYKRIKTTRNISRNIKARIRNNLTQTLLFFFLYLATIPSLFLSWSPHFSFISISHFFSLDNPLFPHNTSSFLSRDINMHFLNPLILFSLKFFHWLSHSLLIFINLKWC